MTDPERKDERAEVVKGKDTKDKDEERKERKESEEP